MRQVNQARWISLSFGATQTLAGILMAAVLIFTITGERKASLRVCCKSSQRVYFRKFQQGQVFFFSDFSIVIEMVMAQSSPARAKRQFLTRKYRYGRELDRRKI